MPLRREVCGKNRTEAHGEGHTTRALRHTQPRSRKKPSGCQSAKVRDRKTPLREQGLRRCLRRKLVQHSRYRQIELSFVDPGGVVYLLSGSLVVSTKTICLHPSGFQIVGRNIDCVVFVYSLLLLCCFYRYYVPHTYTLLITLSICVCVFTISF